MSFQPSDLSLLVSEYDTLVQESTTSRGRIDLDRLNYRLVGEAEWSHRAAAELLALCQRYGSFVLRNAAALALSLGIEDGEEGI